MRRFLRLVLLLLVAGPAMAQTATPTAAPTATPTPTLTPFASAGLLAIVDCTNREGSFITTATRPEIEIRNLGSTRAVVKLSAGISESSPGTPTPYDEEYIIPAGGVFALPRGRARFWYLCGDGTTGLSVAVR